MTETPRPPALRLERSRPRRLLEALLSTLVLARAMALDADRPMVVVGADGAASIRRSQDAVSGDLRLYLHGPD